jgi:hypothetical protein
MSVDALVSFTGLGLRRLVLTMALALAVLGVADYFWQRRRHEQSIKMSRQEVKEEARESEGDPQVRARFRRAHRELAGRRMLAEVKHADVVLTNPTHYAIALRYRAEEMVAPQVIAKGAGELAQKIKDAARSAGVPIVSGARWRGPSTAPSRSAPRYRRPSTAPSPRSSPTSTRCVARPRKGRPSRWPTPPSPSARPSCAPPGLPPGR